MRGDEQRQAGFIVMTTLEDVVPADHPLRAIRAMVDAALEEMSPAARGPLRLRWPPLDRPRVPAARPAHPDPLRDPLRAAPRRAAALQPPAALVRGPAPRRAGLPRDQLHQEPRPPAHERDRRGLLRRDPLPGRGAQAALAVSTSASTAPCIEAAAALKSLRPIEEDEGEEPPAGGGGRNPDVDFHGERRGNADAPLDHRPRGRLARKGNGKEARLCYAGHTLIENRHGLIVECELTQASGTAEREAGLRLLARERGRRGRGRLSVGADKGYDTPDFVAGVRELGVTPHVAPRSATAPSTDAPRATGLRRQPAPAQAHRGGLRLDEDGRRPAQAAPPRQGQGGRPLHLHLRGLQPGAPANLAGGAVFGLR